MEFRQPVWNFEQAVEESGDETSVNLRAYFDRMPDARMLEYRPEWPDDFLTEWDGNFKDDGTLLLPCSERDVQVDEYRTTLEAAIRYRQTLRR